MAEDTGKVRFRGDPNTVCQEARDYREDGGSTLNPGDELEGIPSAMLKRFLLNSDFEAVGDTANKADKELQDERAEALGSSYVNAQSADTGKSLSNMNKSELLEVAGRVGVAADDSMTNKEIVEAIKASEGDNA